MGRITPSESYPGSLDGIKNGSGKDNVEYYELISKKLLETEDGLIGKNDDIQIPELIRIIKGKDNQDDIDKLVRAFVHNFQLKQYADQDILDKQLNILLEFTELANMSPSILSLVCIKVIQFANSSYVSNFLIHSKKFINKIINIALDPLTEFNVLQSICNFLLLLNPLSFNNEIETKFTKLPFLQLPALWNHIYKYYLHKDMLDPMVFETTLNTFTTHLSQYMFVLGHILSRHKNATIFYEINEKMFNCFKILLFSNNFEISLAASYLLIQYAGFSKYKQNISSMVFTTIITLTKKEEMNQSKFASIVMKYNLIETMHPMSILIQALDYSKDSAMTKSLKDIKFVPYLNSIITRITKQHPNNLPIRETYNISRCLTILSFIATYDDDIKLEISKTDFHKVVTGTLKLHFKLLSQISNVENVKLIHSRSIYISNLISYSSCLLLRSLSRSSCLLNLMFYRNNYVNLLMDILSCDRSAIKSLKFSHQLLYNQEISLNTLILGVISNLIIEFSTINDSINLKRLFDILKNLLDNTEYKETLIAVLHLIRNGLFGSYKPFKELFNKVITLPRIFKLCENNDIKIKILSFNIIRNLLTDWTSDGEFAYKSYKSFKENDINDKTNGDLIEFMRLNLNNTDSIKLKNTICYNLVNLAASSINIKIYIMKNKLLLEDLLNLLNTSSDDMNVNDKELFWGLKTSITWIIYNLTSRVESSWNDLNIDNNLNDINNHGINYNNLNEIPEYNTVLERSKLLTSMGFHNSLKKLVEFSPSTDFKERANSAMFQLIVASGGL